MNHDWPPTTCFSSASCQLSKYGLCPALLAQAQKPLLFLPALPQTSMQQPDLPVSPHYKSYWIRILFCNFKSRFQESFLFSQWSSYCLFHRCSILPLWDVNYSGFWQLSSVSCIISIFSVSFLSVLVPASFRCLLSLDVYFHGGEKHKELTGSSVG